MSGRAGWAWRDADVVMVGIVGLVGVVAIIAAWFGAAGTASPATQAVWLNVAVAGFVVSAAGFGLWLMRGRRAVGERRVSLVALAEPESEPVEVGSRSGTPAVTVMVPGGTAPIGAVRVVGGRLVHDPGCPLVAGKELEPVAPGSGAPCGVCVP